MMKEGALRKKLQEIGIPTWGSKDLMKRRHIEWLNIHNSNCDADDSVRKTKRQLVKELEEWENTQGGKADVKESKVMRKDFDGNGYAKSYKSDFDDLIAQARKKRAVPKSDVNNGTEGHAPTTAQRTPQPQHGPDAPNGTAEQPQNSIQGHTKIPNGVDPQQPDTNNVSALTNTSDDAQSANQKESNPTLESGEATAPCEEPLLGIRNPFGSPSRKLPMFTLPEEPVKEVDTSAL
jgi:E3 ubiquitin-protein ligase RAD18